MLYNVRHMVHMYVIPARTHKNAFLWVLMQPFINVAHKTCKNELLMCTCIHVCACMQGLKYMHIHVHVYGISYSGVGHLKMMGRQGSYESRSERYYTMQNDG